MCSSWRRGRERLPRREERDPPLYTSDSWNSWQNTPEE